jgi:hypothetical protein
MRIGKLTTEHLLFGLALLLAAGIRFIGLGSVPLSEGEAGWALQAANLANGSHALIGGQPGYILLTSLTFYLVGVSEFWARLWPALAGTLLVLAPWLFREQIGRKAAVALAFGLALEPSLVAVSHQADGRIIALAGLAFALGFWLRGSIAWAGISAGLALLGGPSVWQGLVVLALGWSAARAVKAIPLLEGQEPAHQWSWRSFLAWTLGTVFFVGTVFWFMPTGLSGWANSLLAYLQGWGAPNGSSLVVMLIAWVGLSPLVVFLGLPGVAKGLAKSGQPVDALLAWLWVFAFLGFLVYPGRTPSDLAWSMVPLLALAARQAVGVVGDVSWRKAILGYTFLSAALVISAAINLAGFSDPARVGEDVLRLSGVLGAIILIAASFLLLTWGWSLRTAWNGLRLGGLAVLLVYTLSTAWFAAGLGPRPAAEIWHQGGVAENWQTNLKVIGDVSEWGSGRRDTLSLVVSDFESPLLRWALFNHHQQSFTAIAGDARPQAVITPETKDAKLNLSSPYTGQALVWSQSVNWAALLPREWLHWLFFRELPTHPEVIDTRPIILWLRSDLFPGAAQSTAVR